MAEIPKSFWGLSFIGLAVAVSLPHLLIHSLGAPRDVLIFIAGFLTAVVCLRPDLIRSEKEMKSGQVSKKSAKSDLLALSDSYAPRHAFASQMQQAVDSILRAANESVGQWQQFDNRGGVTFMQKQVEGNSVPLLRGDATIDAPALGLVQLVIDEANAKLFDPSLKRLQILEELDRQSAVVYTEFSGVGPVSGRDFCVLRHYGQVPGGIILLNTSIEYPGCAKVEGRGLVRGTTPFNGWIFRPNADNTSCRVTFVANVCLNGSLPSFIVNKVAKEAPEKVMHLKKLAASCSFGDSDVFEDIGRKAINRIEDIALQQDWDLVMTKSGVKIYQKADSSHQFKGVGVIQLPPEVVRRALLDVELCLQWDSMCKEAKMVAKINNNTRVVYLRLEAKTCLLRSARDFCLVHSDVLKSDGTFILTGTSTQHPKCPPRADTVRAELKCGGWIVRPIGTHSQVTYIVDLDLHGGLSQTLLDSVAMRVPLAIHYLGSWLATQTQ